MLQDVLLKNRQKFFYGVPNSQNPSGVTYSEERRREIAAILEGTQTFFVEDDAYGELNFSAKSLPSLRRYLPDQTLISGSFSKILAPGMRLGWIVAPEDIMEQVVIAKQASDLHSNYLSQRIAYEYLTHADIDGHIRKIQGVYRHQAGLMQELITKEFPSSVTFTRPQGGMFIWLTLPDGISSMDVFDAAIKERVAVLPGTPFFIDGGGNNTLRINFSNATDEKIHEGIIRLARVIRKLG
jgi:2-aminoadipate transaminase